MKAFFHQPSTAQFRGSQSEVQFTTNTNPIGKATILNISPLPTTGANEEFPEHDIRFIHFLQPH
jgi:hypothetical protein